MVTHPNRSSATQAYRLLLAWDFHPLVIRAVEAHVRDMEVTEHRNVISAGAGVAQIWAVWRLTRRGRSKLGSSQRR
jgi:hypothetical protein